MLLQILEIHESDNGQQTEEPEFRYRI
jgi:hypothetical protein